MARHRTHEALSAATRSRLPAVAGPWLAAVRAEMEKLTMAAIAGEISDEEFRAMAKAASAKLPELLATMEHDALATLMEQGMGAAMANGIEARSTKHEIINEEPDPPDPSGNPRPAPSSV